MKAAAAGVNLRHSIAAFEERLSRLPELEQKVDQAMLEGKPFKLSLYKLLEDYTK